MRGRGKKKSRNERNVDRGKKERRGGEGRGKRKSKISYIVIYIGNIYRETK